MSERKRVRMAGRRFAERQARRRGRGWVRPLLRTAAAVALGVLIAWALVRGLDFLLGPVRPPEPPPAPSGP